LHLVLPRRCDEIVPGSATENDDANERRVGSRVQKSRIQARGMAAAIIEGIHRSDTRGAATLASAAGVVSSDVLAVNGYRPADSGASAASGAFKYLTNHSAAAFALISKGSFEYMSK
jgi:hypothetical protein